MALGFLAAKLKRETQLVPSPQCLLLDMVERAGRSPVPDWSTFCPKSSCLSMKCCSLKVPQAEGQREVTQTCHLDKLSRGITWCGSSLGFWGCQSEMAL